MIRRASFLDVEAILHVINISNSDSYKEIIPAEYFKEPVLTESELVEFFQEMDFYVCEEGDNVIGVAALMIKHESRGELRWVYVLPKYQRRGIGTELIKHLEEEASNQGLTEMILYSDERAIWAINFYEKMGYRQIDKKQLPWGYDILMKKELS